MDGGAPERFRDCIIKAKAGDQAAFSLLYTEWYAPVYRFILLKVGSREVAEDLVQDVFTKLFTHLHSFEIRDAHPLGYLFTVARTTIIDHHKKKKADRLSDEDAHALTDEHARSPEADAGLSLDRKWLAKGMETLTPQQQEVLTLRLIEERPVSEVARMVGTSEEAVRQMQVRALRALRAYFAEQKLV